jgi:hypothetical protein
MNITVNEIISKLSIKELLVKGVNYIQWIDTNNQFCEAGYDYKTQKWYMFKTTGRSDSPIETFIKFIN